MEKTKHLSEVEEARKLIEKDKQERAAKCLQEIEKALRKYNCMLGGIFIADLNGARYKINVIAKN